jgi:alpha-glucuronidase
MVQVKNGPIDFQPREPFHPLFGAMPKTPMMMEFQITQEYLGFSTHLVFLPSLFKEVLDADTHANGSSLTVAQVIEGNEQQHTLSGMAGVANIGNVRNWCGHPFAQANWYGFGRLAWDNALSEAQIAGEWIRMTFTNDPHFVQPVSKLMLASREILVDYMTPLGLHHIMGYNHHYGPGPWVNTASRPDWNSVYYHRADSMGIGFDRTAAGSNALSQYAPKVRSAFENVSTCPQPYLLWFHHLSWDYSLQNGHTLWNELCYKYYAGADSVKWMQQIWATVKGKIDEERFEQVNMLLQIQSREAVWWRDACVLYFQSISNRPIPASLPKPTMTLEYYKSLKFPFAPGI